MRRFFLVALLALLPTAAAAQPPVSAPVPVMYPILERADATWGTTTATCNDASINACSAGSTLELDVRNAASAILWMRPDVTGNVTGGQITFDMSVNGGTTWAEASGSNGDWTQASVLLSGSTYLDGAEAGWRVPVGGSDRMRLRLESAITCAGGAGTCTLIVSGRSSSAPTAGFMVVRQGEWDRLRASVAPYGDSQTTTVTGTNSTAAFDISRTMGNVYLRLFQSGTQWTGTIFFFQSANGTTWETLPCFNAAFTGELAVSATVNSSWFCFATSGMRFVRVTGGTVTNTAGVELYTGSSTAQIMYAAILGSKALGAPATATNPVLTGGYAQLLGANPSVTAVDTNFDATKTLTNVLGMPFVAPMPPNPITREYDFTAAGGARTDFQISETIASGTRAVVTRYSVTASNANSVDVACRMGFGTSTLPAVSATAGTGAVGIFMSHPGIAAGSGVVETQIYALGGDGEEVRATCASPTGGAMRLSVTYYLVP